MRAVFGFACGGNGNAPCSSARQSFQPRPDLDTQKETCRDARAVLSSDANVLAIAFQTLSDAGEERRWRSKWYVR
jgi:hypothetical protein